MRLVLASLFIPALAFADVTPDAGTTKATSDAKVTSSVKVVSTDAGVALPVGTPGDMSEAVDKVKDIISLGKAKNFWGMSAGIIFVVMFILKLFNLFKYIGKRWSYVIVGVLSVAAMLLTKFAAGVSWEGAILVLTSGPSMGYLSDLVKRGILGQEPSTPMKS